MRDDEGRFAPRFDDNDRVTVRCTTVIYCIGQKVEWGSILEGTDVELNAIIYYMQKGWTPRDFSDVENENMWHYYVVAY